ncbi:universal stress protein [Niabella beijingensis]|uniref:universal stress protein n=1 Tax=Niabella beijingensis TaxID=2872700 RepID=UPI001CBA7894|nr:universal stress protein [Niabella beijingensis]MBZ4190553.1 universal stress protein [Niabella beijingensis]
MIKYHIRKIAVATNFSEESDNAVYQAALLAKKHDAGLDIIHAVSPADSRNKKAEFVQAAYEQLKKYRDGILDEFGIEAKVFARVGDVVAFIYKYCIENKTDLLLIGVLNGVKRYFKESMAYGIIMKIECPVLSIPMSFKRSDFHKILFPVRSVEGVKEKLIHSRPFIQKDNSELHIICLRQPDLYKVNEVIELAKNQHIQFSVSDFDADSKKNVAPEVISAAKEKQADLIVINATSEKQWYNIFGENYTEYILKEAEVAVLSITHPFESDNLPDTP